MKNDSNDNRLHLRDHKKDMSDQRKYIFSIQKYYENKSHVPSTLF